MARLLAAQPGGAPQQGQGGAGQHPEGTGHHQRLQQGRVGGRGGHCRGVEEHDVVDMVQRGEPLGGQAADLAGEEHGHLGYRSPHPQLDHVGLGPDGRLVPVSRHRSRVDAQRAGRLVVDRGAAEHFGEGGHDGPAAGVVEGADALLDGGRIGGVEGRADDVAGGGLVDRLGGGVERDGGGDRPRHSEQHEQPPLADGAQHLGGVHHRAPLCASTAGTVRRRIWTSRVRQRRCT